MKIAVFLTGILFLTACSSPAPEDKSQQAKEEIVKAERDFNQLCQDKGIDTAFTTFAAENVTILRKDSLISGKDGVKHFYSNPRFLNVKLTWSPDYVDAAASGDLGYTYGKYVYAVTDSTGKVTEYKGYFHTVWKKQADGTWRFIWD